MTSKEKDSSKTSKTEGCESSVDKLMSCNKSSTSKLKILEETTQAHYFPLHMNLIF